MAEAHKCKSLVSATSSSLDPTPPTKATCEENDTATVVISNCSSTKWTQKLMEPSLAATARSRHGFAVEMGKMQIVKTSGDSRVQRFRMEEEIKKQGWFDKMNPFKKHQ